MEGASAPVTCPWYRSTPGEEEGTPEEGMSTYSVVVLLPDGDVKHQVVWALAPEEIGDAIRGPPGSRVIMTEMKSPLVWESQAMEEEEAVKATPASCPFLREESGSHTFLTSRTIAPPPTNETAMIAKKTM